MSWDLWKVAPAIICHGKANESLGRWEIQEWTGTFAAAPLRGGKEPSPAVLPKFCTVRPRNRSGLREVDWKDHTETQPECLQGVSQWQSTNKGKSGVTGHTVDSSVEGLPCVCYSKEFPNQREFCMTTRYSHCLLFPDYMQNTMETYLKSREDNRQQLRFG